MKGVCLFDNSAVAWVLALGYELTSPTRMHSLYMGNIERFSIECRKNKTKVITLANHKGHR